MLARELTKSHESIITGRITEVMDQQSKSSGKGEFTLVIAPQKTILFRQIRDENWDHRYWIQYL